ncbi:tyrosine-type recombinase/integrase [Salinimonas iocasae]|uniref:Site-specific integrase n=1 Tax=Salinimonas iocasae TaxID=2572577 RepID=A0A5B7Y970_9ALTE|nr:site-specific integrase [Salinimonas iocasae]QCZ92181.1 site-specific integrase [Salinimonas iocasae]
MSVLKQKNGFYQIRFQFSGKKYQRSAKTKNKAKAMELERKWRNELLDNQQHEKSEEISLYNAIDLFVTSKSGMKTLDDVKSKVRTVKRYFTDKPVHELTTRDVEMFVNKRKAEGKAAQTIEHSIIQLRGCVSYAKRLGYRVGEIEFPKLKVDNKRIRCLTPDEEKRLLKELEPNNPDYCSSVTPMEDRTQLLQQRQDNYDLVICLLDTGARYSEIAQMCFKQVDLQSRTIHLVRTKTNNESTLLMSNRVYQVLKRRYDNRAQDKWVFTDKSGNQPRQHATISIRKAIDNAGIENFKVHDFRHTCASRLVQNGLTIQEVAMVLGHRNLSTTLRYAHHEQKQVATKMKNVLDSINDAA